MSTLADFELDDDPPSIHPDPGPIQARPSEKPAETLARSRRSMDTGPFRQVATRGGIHTHTHACAEDASHTGQSKSMDRVDRVDQASKSAGLKNSEPGSKTASPGEPGSPTASLHPAGGVALGPDDPGDEGLAWHGEYEAPLPPASEPVPPRPSHAPAPGSLVQRLVAAGATVRTWSDGRGGKASIEAPAGIPLELVEEIERRGWAIIPGGKPNTEAEHDSWLAGVPIADLEP